MHSLVDVLVGLAIGLVILAFWVTVHEYVDNFIVSGQNGEYASSGAFMVLNCRDVSMIIVESMALADVM